MGHCPTPTLRRKREGWGTRDQCRYTNDMRGLKIFTLAGGVLVLFGAMAGCHSHYVQTTIVNDGPTTLENIEVDYPSASFGIASLAPGARYNYRFKIQGSGLMHLLSQDAAGKSQTEAGPFVAEGQEGTLEIDMNRAGKNVWTVKLAPQVNAPK